MKKWMNVDEYGLMLAMIIVISIIFLSVFFIKIGCEKVELEISYNQHSTGIFSSENNIRDYKISSLETCLNEKFYINEEDGFICGAYIIINEEDDNYLIIPEYMRLTNGGKDKRILFEGTVSLRGSSLTDNICYVNMTLLNSP